MKIQERFIWQVTNTDSIQQSNGNLLQGINLMAPLLITSSLQLMRM